MTEIATLPLARRLLESGCALTVDRALGDAYIHRNAYASRPVAEAVWRELLASGALVRLNRDDLTSIEVYDLRAA